jgi:hypothetical protein
MQQQMDRHAQEMAAMQQQQQAAMQQQQQQIAMQQQAHEQQLTAVALQVQAAQWGMQMQQMPAVATRNVHLPQAAVRAKPLWPQNFETHGSAFVFQPNSGYFFEYEFNKGSSFWIDSIDLTSIRSPRELSLIVVNAVKS